VLPPGRTILIRGIPELSGIREADGVIRIGAAASAASLLGSSLVRERIPLLIASLERFGSPQIRSMATLGGNICNGSPTADTVPPLLVLEAELELSSRGGTRLLPLRSFFTGYKRNALREGEILSAVLVRAAGLEGWRWFYRKIGSRSTMTIAKAAVALAARTGGAEGRIEDIRLAVGSVSEYPRRAERTEELLRGRDPRALGAGRIASCLSAEITPISDFRSDAAYRERVCVNLVLSALGVSAPGTR
jgi:CO/xanthine dehydrogenase FAD-binding subunit